MILYTLLYMSPLLVASCPFKGSNHDVIPSDDNHRFLRSRLGSLKVGETERKLMSIIAEQQERSLQTNCVTQSVYDDIQTNVAEMGNAIQDDGDKGHFWGAIVRLAAHDFMDFDRNFSGDERLGSDGCLEFDNGANAGLDDIWCDSCALKQLYDTSYASFMSRADFWVAAANGVISETSEGLNLPFRWGRVDRNVCPLSSGRLPEASGCNEVEETFIDRMGVTWRDAVALIGAHTLGRGHTRFSGHDGTWVQNDEESTIFDTGFFTETVNRGWRPRDTDAGTDWTWGGTNNDVMMLNTDICLRFDIPDGDDQDCCTNTGENCGPGNLPQCDSSESVRPEAYQAFTDFTSRNNNAFYNAFSEAWEKATENGYEEGELNDLTDSCDSSTGPTFAPTPAPTPAPTTGPKPSVTLVPTPSPTPFPTDASFPTLEPTRRRTRGPTRGPTRPPYRRSGGGGGGGGGDRSFWE